MELHGPGRALADTPAGRQEAGVQLQRGRADGDAQRAFRIPSLARHARRRGPGLKPGGGTCTTQSLGSVTTRSLKHAASPSVSSSTNMASMLGACVVAGWPAAASCSGARRRLLQPDRQRRQADAWVIDDVWPEFARQRHGLRHRIRRRQAVAAIETVRAAASTTPAIATPCSSKRARAAQGRRSACDTGNAAPRMPPAPPASRAARALADERACRRVRRPAAAGAAGG